jgi:hypothetical protein
VGQPANPRILTRMLSTASEACKTNVLVCFFGGRSDQRFVSGHDFSRAVQAAHDEGFSPCGPLSIPVGFCAAFASSPSHEDIIFAVFNKAVPFCSWACLNAMFDPTFGTLNFFQRGRRLP